MTQVENHELSSDTMALHRRESASLWEWHEEILENDEKILGKIWGWKCSSIIYISKCS